MDTDEHRVGRASTGLPSTLAWVVSVIVAAAWTVDAHAQATTTTTTTTGTEPATTTYAAPPPESPPPAEVREERPRQSGHTARLGLDLGGGILLGDSRGASFNANFQLGYQASKLFAIYWQPGLAVDAWTEGDTEASIFVNSPQLLAMDLTLGRVFQIGVGGGVDVGRFGYCTATDTDEPDCEVRSREVHPSAEGRVAFVIPLPGIRARWGIPLAVRYHATFIEDRPIHGVQFSVGLLRY